MSRLSTLLVIFSTIFSFQSFSQSWHSAQETIEYKPNPIGQISMDYVESYDTVACQYKMVGSDKIYSGYKLFFKKNGFYTDNSNTFNVFFDTEKKRINGVSSYQYPVHNL